MQDDGIGESMRKFVDQNYPDVVVTESQLFSEYEESGEADEISFDDYILNCLERNGGTLREIT